MKDFMIGAAWTLAALVGVTLLTFFLNALGWLSLSFWGPKYEETNRRIVQQSIRRQEGVNEGIAALCLNMRLEKDPAAKKAFANMIEVQASATGTELNAETMNCKAEAERNLAI